MAKRYFRYQKYDMRSADYERMFKHQQGRCAICNCEPEEGKRLDIDHDHASGEVRGLLCGPHNRMLGLAYDSPEILRAAARYLENGGHPSRFHVRGGCLLELKDSK